MTSIDFHFRPSRRQRRLPGSIFVRVIHQRKIRSITLPLKVYPEEWDAVEHQVLFRPENKARFGELSRIAAEMERIYQRLRQRIDRFEAEGRPYVAADILDEYRHREGNHLLGNFVNKITSEMLSHGQERTARGYQTAVRRLFTFLKVDDLPLRQITSFLIRRFEHALRQEEKALNTISFYMRNLRAVYNRAIREGILEKSQINPFEGVCTGVYVTRKRALTRDEMRMLQEWCPLLGGKSVNENKESGKSINEEFSQRISLQEGLQRAQYFFLFSFHARGMSFVDLAYLRKENISNGVVTYCRKKTGQLLEIRINNEMKNILHYFEQEMRNSEYVFPIITDPDKPERLQYESALRTYNNRLKRLAERLKVENRKKTVESGKLNQRSALAKIESEKETAEKNKNSNPNNYQLSTISCQLSSHVARHIKSFNHVYFNALQSRICR